ncbi:hypothetical protein V5O48_014471 [Marasmius crinis-equi]|uniref:CxC2-like cysteine cluster KDZ transposase-associated domain-containing protein n=1 Tax=Marasmius crinis-equi TaxID=585013 RepID=A0ABR3EX83_9AGAR
MGKGQASTRKFTSRAIRGPDHMFRGDTWSQSQKTSLKRHTFSTIQHEKRKDKTGIPVEINDSANPTLADLRAENDQVMQAAMLDDAGVQGMALVEDAGMEDGWLDEEGMEVQEQTDYVELFHNTREILKKLEYRNQRTRRDKVQLDQERWLPQLDEMTDAFMDWEHRQEYNLPCEREAYLIETPKYVDFDGFWMSVEFKMLRGDTYKSSSYIRNGAFPSIQPFIRGLCDRFCMPFNNHYAIQFSVAYDLYLEVKQRIRARVSIALGRSSPDWRMLNSCPSCQYPVVGQNDLHIRMLCCMDGNDSLKRVERREKAHNDDGGRALGSSCERPNARVGGDDYFLLHETVDKWDIKEWRKGKGRDVSEDEKGTPCEEKWKNMNDAHTAKSWAIFDMQGWFVMLCRHGFLLKAADFVRSGEQRKYPLAILDCFLSACQEEARRYGDNMPKGILGVGYDLGCKLKATIEESPLSNLAAQEQLMMLIGILHGHAHNRLCQLLFLLIYVLGAGLENLEGCERYFSKSNALASVTRHASKFHRRQAITEYARHNDNFEVYANLSKLLRGNYKSALDIIATENGVVAEMKRAGLTRVEMVFDWLEEERKYLVAKMNQVEPPREGFGENVLRGAGIAQSVQAWKPGSNEPGQRKLEKSLRDDQEMEFKHIRDIQDLEARLEVGKGERWMAGSPNWVRVEKSISEREYWRAADCLEGLMVARMQEMGRLNIAGTGEWSGSKCMAKLTSLIGYRMRQHIAKAMQTRAKAIDSALKDYNSRAQAMNPPRPKLDLKELMEYTFLSDFELLKETKSEVLEKPWARPGNRLLVTKIFKLFRAEEEVDRLNNEIQSLYTYIQEETAYLRQREEELKSTDFLLGFQVRLHRYERGRFNGTHLRRLKKIQKLPGFQSSWSRFFQPGVGVKKKVLREGELQAASEEMSRLAQDREGEDDDSKSEGEEEESAEIDVAITTLDVATGSSGDSPRQESV